MHRFDSRGALSSLEPSRNANTVENHYEGSKNKLTRASQYVSGSRDHKYSGHSINGKRSYVSDLETKTHSDSALNCRNVTIRSGEKDNGERIDLREREREHTSHVHTTMNRSNSYAFLIMILDGIGLSIITGCTLLQAFSEWQKLHRHHYQYNVLCLSLLICGRICQILGLLLLIGFAFTMEKFPDLEKGGMGMLTVGPVLTAAASAMFDSGGLDPHALLNKRMVLTELVELTGILFLDLSFADAPNFLILSIEIAGFITLMLSAMCEFDFSPLVTQDSNGFLSNSILSHYDAVIATFQATTFKWELVRVSDCFGLLLLTLVSYCQYRERAWEELKEKEKERSEKETDKLSVV